MILPDLINPALSEINNKELSEIDICDLYITPAIINASWDQMFQYTLLRNTQRVKGEDWGSAGCPATPCRCANRCGDLTH